MHWAMTTPERKPNRFMTLIAWASHNSDSVKLRKSVLRQLSPGRGTGTGNINILSVYNLWKPKSYRRFDQEKKNNVWVARMLAACLIFQGKCLKKKHADANICACQPCTSGIQIFLLQVFVGMYFHLNFLALSRIVWASTVPCLVPMVPM